MKLSGWILTAAITATLAMAGGGKNGTVDTAVFEKSFKTAEAAVQTSAEKVTTAIKAGDYTGAMAELKTLASNAKLTSEQQQTIKDVIAQVEKLVADAASKVAGDASKAVKDLPTTLPK